MSAASHLPEPKPVAGVSPAAPDAPFSRRRSPHVTLRWLAMLVLLASLTLETLPIFTWLAVLAATSGNRPEDAALPFWYLFAVVLGAWGVSSLFGGWMAGENARSVGRRTGILRAALLLVGWGVSLVCAIAISPATTGAQLASGAGASSAFGLAVLLAYLWWRGLRLRQSPITRERLYLRFILGLGALIFAVAGAVAAPGRLYDAVNALLLLTLPGETFAGLVGLMLASVVDTAYEQRATAGRGAGESVAAMTRAWLVTALSLSVAVALVTILVTLLFSPGSMSAFLAFLSPMGALLGRMLDGIVALVAFVLYWLFNIPLEWIASHIHPRKRVPPPQSPTAPRAAPRQLQSHIPPALLTTARWVVAALVILVILFLVMQALRYYTVLRRPEAFDEEHMSLDAREVLQGQFRRWLAQRRRRDAGDAHDKEDALAPGSVRYLYRDLLRTASKYGYRRLGSETPNEYAARVASLLAVDMRGTRAAASTPEVPEVSRAVTELAILTDAYTAARYGAEEDGGEDGGASSDLLAAQRHLKHVLRKEAPEPVADTEAGARGGARRGARQRFRGRWRRGGSPARGRVISKSYVM